MAIDDLPLPVVNFLNVIGVPWPYVDEGQLIEFAQLTRDFAKAVQSTHDDATRAVADIASAYQGSATNAMSLGWARMSAGHIDVVVDATHVLAAALDGAAGYIVAQKAEAISVLIGMAAAFVADQAAAVAAYDRFAEGGKRAVQSFLSEFHVPYPVLMPDFALPSAPAVDALPTTVLLDRSGRAAKSYIGAVRESVFRSDVDRLLAEQSPPSFGI